MTEVAERYGVTRQSLYNLLGSLSEERRCLDVIGQRS